MQELIAELKDSLPSLEEIRELVHQRLQILATAAKEADALVEKTYVEGLDALKRRHEELKAMVVQKRHTREKELYAQEAALDCIIGCATGGDKQIEHMRQGRQHPRLLQFKRLLERCVERSQGLERDLGYGSGPALEFVPRQV